MEDKKGSKEQNTEENNEFKFEYKWKSCPYLGDCR